jgi:ferredoxin
MGHTVGKDIFRDLGKKIDSLTMRVPWNKTFHAILKELYSEEEAELIIRMPPGLATAKELEIVTQYPLKRLRKLLDKLCRKGLVVDLYVNDAYYYIPSPLVVGIFEFTMMRTDNHLDIKKLAKLFYAYMNDETFYSANFGNGKYQRMGIMRTVPYEESLVNGKALAEEGYVEVLDYEKATAIIEQQDRFSVGHCSCRHMALHSGNKPCDMPVDTCTSFGYSAEYLIRNNLAKEVSKEEMLDLVARSKELGLMLNADNVKNNCQFICHCCKCCCHVLLGLTRFGYPEVIVTSSLLAEVEAEKCIGCGACVKVCGVEAITLVDGPGQETKNKKRIQIDQSTCVGCGVCVTRCKQGAIKMVKRKQRVLHPENTFEKAILKHLELGTLQDQLFNNPRSITQKVLRGIVGGFLRLAPVKRAVMSDRMRSSFFKLMEKGARLQGKEWLTEL